MICGLELLPDSAFEGVLLWLSLRDLAALAASSSTLHALIGQQPEAVWRTVAEQDAGICTACHTALCLGMCRCSPTGAAEYVPGDPMRKAPCILDALRRHHAARCNMAKGLCQRQEGQLPESYLPGTCSFECLQHAAMERNGESWEVHIIDLLTGAVLHRWAFPEHAGVTSPAQWQWCGPTIAVPCADTGDSSLLMLDVPSGVWTSVARQAGDAVALPQRLSTQISGWSCRQGSGLLIAQSNGSRGVVQLCSPQGLVRTESVPGCSRGRGFGASAFLKVLWAPDAQAALLVESAHSSFWLWEVHGGEPEQFELEIAAEKAVWAPDSCSLLFVDMEDSSSLLLWSRQGKQCLYLTAATASESWDLLWGNHGRIVLQGPYEGEDEWGFEDKSQSCWRCYTLEGGQLVAGHLCETTLGQWESYCEGPLALAPDGSAFATATRFHQDRLEERCNVPDDRHSGVAVVDMGGWVRHQIETSFPPGMLEWAADGSALLISNGGSADFLLVSYM